MEFTVSDVCNVFVHGENRFIVPCLDFKVYGAEQYFRMFMCTKRGEERSLKNSMLFGKGSETVLGTETSKYNLITY
jgi:hypothetical protein